MYIVLSYDISSSNGTRIRKECERYLTHVQKSVFEGEISERKLKMLKAAIARIIEPELDSVIIYRMDPFGSVRRENIGKSIYPDITYL